VPQGISAGRLGGVPAFHLQPGWELLGWRVDRVITLYIPGSIMPTLAPSCRAGPLLVLGGLLQQQDGVRSQPYSVQQVFMQHHLL
jgi:hypothetical protein